MHVPRGLPWNELAPVQMAPSLYGYIYSERLCGIYLFVLQLTDRVCVAVKKPVACLF